MMRELYERSNRQVPFAQKGSNLLNEPIQGPGVPANNYGVSPEDIDKVDAWIADGFTIPMRTPDDTLIFVSKEKSKEIKSHRAECVGCISSCKLSTWCEDADKKYSTGKLPDPRVHCIRKGLQKAIAVN
ncbi:hypothetical protein, partial [Falsihalocynthiibacter sp. CO-5D18]|uniref:hypothetical protein n=1 Tax=Falsihalocynthiibacter sp. CO-5D18 TaxID=3240872 RepID=UPI00350F3BCC